MAALYEAPISIVNHLSLASIHRMVDYVVAQKKINAHDIFMHYLELSNVKDNKNTKRMWREKKYPHLKISNRK